MGRCYLQQSSAAGCRHNLTHITNGLSISPVKDRSITDGLGIKPQASLRIQEASLLLTSCTMPHLTVFGANLPASNPPGAQPIIPPRLNIADLIKNEKQWSLYIQAIGEFEIW